MTDDELISARIVVTRRITGGGDDQVLVEGAEHLSLIEALGLLRFAEDTVIRERMEGVG